MWERGVVCRMSFSDLPFAVDEIHDKEIEDGDQEHQDRVVKEDLVELVHQEETKDCE